MSYTASEFVFSYTVLLNLFTAKLVTRYVDTKVCKNQALGSEVERTDVRVCTHTHTHTEHTNHISLLPPSL
jgi:hypothetical protein